MSHAGYLELRLDFLKTEDITISNLRKWLRLSEIPVIVTLRRKSNGGEFHGTEAEQVRVIGSAIASGAAFADLEIETVEHFLNGDLAPLKKGPTKLIVSYHNFEETPVDLKAIHERVVAVRPDIVKVATLARSFSDNLRVLNLIERAKHFQVPFIAVAMGELGVYTRIMGPSRGSLLTYGSIAQGQETAAGQFSLEDLEQTYHVDAIDDQTQVYGVLGYPIGHSLSPYIHNSAFGALGLNCRYLPFSVQNLEDFGKHLGTFAGLSVTIPHKLEILKYVDEVDGTVKATGAANTLVKRSGRIVAYNTDVDGVRQALRASLREGIQRAVMLGAGGAARSAAVVLKEANCQVTVLARDPRKARALADEFSFDFDSLSQATQYSGDLLINCTPIGMTPKTDETPVDREAIRYRYVFDMVYNPLETRLLREARDRATVISGSEMFLYQAARQFELWTNSQAPLDLMRRVVLQKLSSVNRAFESGKGLRQA